MMLKDLVGFCIFYLQLVTVRTKTK